MNLWDLTASAATAGKRSPKYPRPWKAVGESARRGDAAGRTPQEVTALLRERFGQSAAST